MNWPDVIDGWTYIKNGSKVKYYAVYDNEHYQEAIVISQPPQMPGKPREVEIEVKGKRFYTDYSKIKPM